MQPEPPGMEKSKISLPPEAFLHASLRFNWKRGHSWLLDEILEHDF